MDRYKDRSTRILLSIGEKSDFTSSRNLGSYRETAPATRRSDLSIRRENPARAENRRPKDTLLGFIAVRNYKTPQTYYARKTTKRQTHNAVIMCLGRRTCNVIYAMLKTNYSTKSRADQYRQSHLNEEVTRPDGTS